MSGASDSTFGSNGLRERARAAFAAIRARHGDRLADEARSAAAAEVWSTLAELGFFASLVPESHGGRKGGLVAATLLMEELAGQALHNFQPILSAMGTVSLAACAGEALQREFLPRLAAGRLKLAIGSTEEEAGFNVLNIRTRAAAAEDGFRVDGSKIYISGFDIADEMLLVTRTIPIEECARRGLPKTAGITLLLVDPRSSGISHERLPSRGEGVLAQFRVDLENVHVPAARLVGERDQGSRAMFHLFNPERTLASAMALGISRFCLERACEHARRRKVFGETPIGAYQAIQHPLADAQVRLTATRLLAYRAAALFDAGADLQQVAVAANSAKYLSSELALRAIDAAIDVFGGKGFDERHGLIHLWEGARLLQTAPISNALILNQIAQRVLDLPRSY
jgi:alkylation response protein AidB-like acyl-CoA dehydrogenase